jgi:hypothetical protein
MLRLICHVCHHGQLLAGVKTDPKPQQSAYTTGEKSKKGIMGSKKNGYHNYRNGKHDISIVPVAMTVFGSISLSCCRVNSFIFSPHII